MAEFQSEYQSYMNSVQSQAIDISDNIYSSAGEIGETDERNREGLASTSPTDPNALAF